MAESDEMKEMEMNITDNTILQWLLEEENPSVRHQALVNLLGMDDQDPEVIRTAGRIMTEGVVPRILEKQNPDGSFGDAALFYRDKYRGTVWTLLILAELGADGGDERIRKACSFLLEHSLEPASGAFSFDSSKTTGAGLPGGVIPCLTGNLTWAVIRLGWLHDPRVQGAIGWICRWQRADDGDGEAPEGELYAKRRACWGKHSCHMGVAKCLKALAAIPEAERSPEVRAKIGEFAEYFLKHHLYKKSHDPAQVSKPGWLKLGFPLMYQTDVLELLLFFTSFGIRDERLEEARELVRSKCGGDGKWRLENSYNGRTLVSIEAKGRPSKWITLRALEVLK